MSTSISSVKAEQIAEVSASDFRQALAGKMPGVQVTQPSGDPEGSVSIRVRVSVQSMRGVILSISLTVYLWSVALPI